jgi:predicted oxidoreductase
MNNDFKWNLTWTVKLPPGYFNTVLNKGFDKIKFDAIDKSVARMEEFPDAMQVIEQVKQK